MSWALHPSLAQRINESGLLNSARAKGGHAFESPPSSGDSRVLRARFPPEAALHFQERGRMRSVGQRLFDHESPGDSQGKEPAETRQGVNSRQRTLIFGMGSSGICINTTRLK